MLSVDFKDKNSIYQFIAGISGFAVIMIGCVIIMAPFFPAILLATILTLATWPAFTWLNKRFQHKTAFTAFLMTCFLAGCFILPVVVIGTSIADNFTKVYTTAQEFIKKDPAETAATLEGVPYVGQHLAEYWQKIITDKEGLSASLQEYAAPTSQKLISLGTTIGYGIFDITIGVLISYFFFRHGTHVAVRLDNLIERFVGEKGKHVLDVAKKTLTGVVYGILGTALAQGLLATFAFWIAGIPGAAFLGLMTFFLSFIPIGPALVWGPAAFWLYSEGGTAWAIFLVLWGALVIGSVDNFLKPYFISLGSNLPLLLVLLGVLGGALAFGFIGVFIGPTVLAVAYSLILEWSNVRKNVQPETQRGSERG